MIFTHICGGYISGILLEKKENELDRNHYYQYWGAAFIASVAPDFDIAYNLLFRSTLNHYLLITHSILIPLVLLLIGGVTSVMGDKFRHFSILFFVTSLAWFSHLVLDIFAHTTPLFYPFTKMMVGWVPSEIYHGGIWYYLSHPWVLFELVLFSITVLIFLRRHGHFNSVLATLIYGFCVCFIGTIIFLQLPNIRLLLFQQFLNE